MILCQRKAKRTIRCDECPNGGIYSSLWTYCILVLWLLKKKIIIFELGFPEWLAKNQRKVLQPTGHTAWRRAWRSGCVQWLQAEPSKHGGWKSRWRGWGAWPQQNHRVSAPLPNTGRDSLILSYYCDPPLIVCMCRTRGTKPLRSLTGVHRQKMVESEPRKTEQLKNYLLPIGQSLRVKTPTI